MTRHAIQLAPINKLKSGRLDIHDLLIKKGEKRKEEEEEEKLETCTEEEARWNKACN